MSGFQWYLFALMLRACCEKKSLTAISGTDQSQLCVAWWTRSNWNNRLSAVPIFLASLVFPCLDFRAPAFAMSFHGSTNSRGKIGTARSLQTNYKSVWEELRVFVCQHMSYMHWQKYYRIYPCIMCTFFLQILPLKSRCALYTHASYEVICITTQKVQCRTTPNFMQPVEINQDKKFV